MPEGTPGRISKLILIAATTGLGLACAVSTPDPAAPVARGAAWRLPVVLRTLPNGLTVVVSEDRSAPTFGVAIAYGIGFRLEPKGRSGFAHLFEHMMFEGTPNAPKGTIGKVIEGSGGYLNGWTRSDHTIYVATAPIASLDAVLWLMADQMKGLDFSEKNLANQQDVVKEELRTVVLNRPYGLFYWFDLSGRAFDRWENSHDGYGSFGDLEAARIADVKTFFGTYYTPGNAVLAVAGDVAADEVLAKAQRFFGGIPSRPLPPRVEVDEPPNTAERWLEQTDPLAQVPGIAIGYKLPGAGSRDWVGAAVLARVLVGDAASRLSQGLVKGRELLLEVDGGLNLGSPWEIRGPALMTFFGPYKPAAGARTVVAAVDEIVSSIAKEGVPDAELARVKARMEADLYSALDSPLGRARALSTTQLLSGGAAGVSSLPERIRAVSSDDLRRVASAYLTAANRTVIVRRPASPAPAAPAGRAPATPAGGGA